MKLFDSSPLIAILGNLNDPEIIRTLIKLRYTLHAPHEVVEEVTHSPEKEHVQQMITNSSLCKLAPCNQDEIQAFRNRFFQLGKGETEVILWGSAWQKEHKKFCCIIDDNRARKIAEQHGLRCTGTIGLLIKLKEKNFISEDEFKEKIDKLKEYGFRYDFNKIPKKVEGCQ
jgi:predicted nucleic acid-binding protein